jgi:hypothetical protein
MEVKGDLHAEAHFGGIKQQKCVTETRWQILPHTPAQVEFRLAFSLVKAGYRRKSGCLMRRIVGEGEEA